MNCITCLSSRRCLTIEGKMVIATVGDAASEGGISIGVIARQLVAPASRFGAAEMRGERQQGEQPVLCFSWGDNWDCSGPNWQFTLAAVRADLLLMSA